jgi:hypothetical protein
VVKASAKISNFSYITNYLKIQETYKMAANAEKHARIDRITVKITYGIAA